LKVLDNLSIVGSSEYLTTDDFCIYAAKNPFWADCKSNEMICELKDRKGVAVNLVDAEDSRYFNVKIFKYLVRLTHEQIKKGNNVTIVCNKGQSRSPSIAMLYMCATGEITNESYKKAKAEFIAYYPEYSPGRGISNFLENTWNFYFNHKKKY